MNSALLLKQLLEEVKKVKWFKDNSLSIILMNNLRGYERGLEDEEYSYLYVYSLIICCYLIYIFKEKKNIKII
jgi:hypothetical protein